jgi:hypothetical protein
MQQTPTGHEIPVPARKDVFADLGKVAKAKPPEPDENDSDTRVGGTEEE